MATAKPISYALKNIDPALWDKVRKRLDSEHRTTRVVVVRLLELYALAGLDALSPMKNESVDARIQTGSPVDSLTASTRDERATAGPWRIGAHLHERRFRDDNAIEIQDAGGQMIACLFKRNRGMDGGEDTANARLLAAAPDLLDSLKHIVKLIDSDAFGVTVATGYPFTLSEARAAIRKAEGSL